MEAQAADVIAAAADPKQVQREILQMLQAGAADHRRFENEVIGLLQKLVD